MILIDSNTPMYLVGAARPNKDRAQRLLDTAISRGERLVTDVETLQEILHDASAEPGLHLGPVWAVTRVRRTPGYAARSQMWSGSRQRHTRISEQLNGV